MQIDESLAELKGMDKVLNESSPKLQRYVGLLLQVGCKIEYNKGYRLGLVSGVCFTTALVYSLKIFGGLA